jgi:hypothetical protein
MNPPLLGLGLCLLAFAGLALGVILRKKKLRGGCGGPAQGDCQESSGSCSCKDEKPR